MAEAGVTMPPAPSAEQLRSMLDRVTEGVLLIARDGRIAWANASAKRLLGLPEGAEWVWGQGGHTALRALVEEAVATGTPQIREVSLQSAEERTVEVQILYSPSAEDSLIAVVLHDVTQLRRLERVRQDFVANVSHELRTPLTSIKGFIETLLRGAIDDADHNRRFLHLVDEDVNRLARLTDDLLTLSTVESFGKPKTIQAVDLPALVKEVVEALQPQMRQRQLSIAITPVLRPAQAKGDPDQIRQVLWNLLDNAVKYNVDGGRIEVALHADGAWMTIHVVDSGIGIPAEELPRIFERFYRVDKARSRALGGTGLGLSIVKHIVEAHGGQVHVTSQPACGSSFQVTLPAWQL